MVSTKDLCFFILLSLLCVVNLDANLLPDTLVRTGSYTFSNVEALEVGDSLLSVNDNYNDNNLQCVLDRARVVQKKLMPSYVNRVTKLELVSSSGRRGYLYIGKKQRFYRWNALKLSDGRKVDVRTKSNDERVTLEIIKKNGRRLKIRYND